MRPIEHTFWQAYLESLPQKSLPLNPFVEASPAGNINTTDGLIDLYLAGKKSAGSSLVEDFEVEGDPLPKVGNYWIVLNSQNKPMLILKTIKVEIHLFNDVPEYIAKAEGEGDCSLEYWRKVHIEFFSPYLTSWHLKRIDDAHVVTEFLEIVWQ